MGKLRKYVRPVAVCPCRRSPNRDRSSLGTARAWIKAETQYLSHHSRLSSESNEAGALNFDELAALDVFADAGGGPVQRRTELDSTGSVRFGDAGKRGFVIGAERFVIDSIVPWGARLHLHRGGEMPLAERGFRMPPFAGRQLDGAAYRLARRPGRLTVADGAR